MEYKFLEPELFSVSLQAINHADGGFWRLIALGKEENVRNVGFD